MIISDDVLRKAEHWKNSARKHHELVLRVSEHVFFLGLLKSKTFLDVRYTCICCSRHVLNNIKYYGNVFANNAISMVITKYIPDLKTFIKIRERVLPSLVHVYSLKRNKKPNIRTINTVN